MEVHALEEIDRALDAGAKIIGINNRNLATFEVDLSVTERLSEEVPDEVKTGEWQDQECPGRRAHVERCGVDAILVGEALMRGEADRGFAQLGRAIDLIWSARSSHRRKEANRFTASWAAPDRATSTGQFA